MTPINQIIIGFIIIAICAIGGTAGGIMVKNGVDRKNAAKAFEDENISSPDVTSYNQSGGITAGIINFNNLIPEATVETKVLTDNEQLNGSFMTTFEINIINKIPINRLHLKIMAPTIIEAGATPLNGEIAYMDSWAVGNGYAATVIPSASGRYRITAITKEKEKFNIDYKID